MEIEVYENVAAVSEAAAQYICRTAQEAVLEKGHFLLALAGGRTPNLLYRRLAEQPYFSKMPWQQTFVFWGDERFVPPLHIDSNYGAAWLQLFRKINISSEHIYPIPTILTNLDNSAILYEQMIRRAFTSLSAKQFDLTLLGMGDDGHTASLFPGREAVAERVRWVVPTENPAGQQRLSLTLPILNESKQILFLVTGVEKKAMLQKVANDQRQEIKQYPAAMIKGRARTLWMVDSAAYES